MPRLFVGLPVTVDAGHALSRWAYLTLAGQAVRVIEARNLHVTMAFCGEVPEERVPDVCDIVDEEVPADLAWRLDPLAVRVMGSVVAVTYTVPGGLSDVQRRVERRLVADGLAEDEHRRWLPHVTVGRGIHRFRPRVPDSALPVVVLAGDEVAVYESLLSPKGAEYAVIASSPRR